MKKTIILCAALLGGGTALTAQDAAPAVSESSYAVTVDFPYVTKYVFRGLQIARDSFQPSVEIAAGDFYAGVWNNTPLRSEHDGNISKEIDLYVGWTPALTESLKADFGATIYWYPRVNSYLASDSFEMFAGLNWTTGNFTPAAYVYRDFNLHAWTVQGSIGYSVPLTGLGTSLDLNATVGTVSPDDGDSYEYFSVGMNMPVKLSDMVKLNFGVTYTANNIDGGEDPGLWGTAGVTASF